MSYIKLTTKLPNPNDEELINNLQKYEARSMHGQLPVVWDKAKGFQVYDRYGNIFLDFTSGIAVTNVGHGNGYIRSAIGTLLNKPLLHSYTFVTEPRYNFLKYLVNTCYPNGKAFLVSAGTEATEVACKLMRMYGMNKHPDKRLILSFKGSMHGRTFLSENLKGIIDNNLWAFSFDPPNRALEWEEDLTRLDPIEVKHICGIIIESYQGWSAKFFSSKYIQNLVKWAKEHDILVCFDEIQGGFGRTGKMWAWEHYGIEKPDLICFGKGVSSSVPLSGVLGREDLLDLPEVGSMSSTHSANPIACAVGTVNLFVLGELDLINESARKGEILHKYLRDLGLEVNGKGLLAGIITKTEEEANRIVMECFKKGLLLIWTHKNSVKIAPPLTIPDEALLEGLEIIKDTLS